MSNNGNEGHGKDANSQEDLRPRSKHLFTVWASIPCEYKSVDAATCGPERLSEEKTEEIEAILTESV